MKKGWIVIGIAIVCIAGWLVSWNAFGESWLEGLRIEGAVYDSSEEPEQEPTADSRETTENTNPKDTQDMTTQEEASFSQTTEELTTQERAWEEEEYGDIFADNGYPYLIKVNRQQNVVTIYTLDENGDYTVPYRAMVCSVGLRNNTPCGTFTLQQDRYPWRALYGNVYGQYAVRIRKSIMFHSVPYLEPRIDALESEEYNKLGEAASLGCIRLSVEDAKWIYENCEAGTLVQIFDSDYTGPLGKPTPITLDLTDDKSNYDPTDDDPESPWN